jgi:pyruvate,water dikinase
MQYIRRFSELNMDDVPLVGGKNASLGEMYSSLSSLGIKVPNGFTITADGYRHFIEHNKLQDKIDKTLSQLDTHNYTSLAAAGASIREGIMHGDMPDDLVEEICKGYEELAQEYGDNPDVAVRSSATAEDLPGASFAGQQETYLNIRGRKNLVTTCRQVFASLFTDRAISYRVDKGFADVDVALSIGVQKMVRSDIGCSGVMFTIDTETGFRDVVFITAAYGLGENIVQGKVNPDEFYVFKPTLEKGCRPILKRQLGDKAIKMIYTSDSIAGISTRNVHVQREGREKFALTDDEVLELARYGVTIEDHYSKRAGKPMPMDIEWARDGETNELFILQARPETVQASADIRYRETFTLKTRGNVLAKGKSVGQRIATGNARVILEAAQMGELKPGEILVSDITDPDWEPVMKIAAGIVTNRGGRTCHAAIVARELGRSPSHVPRVILVTSMKAHRNSKRTASTCRTSSNSRHGSWSISPTLSRHSMSRGYPVTAWVWHVLSSSSTPASVSIPVPSSNMTHSTRIPGKRLTGSPPATPTARPFISSALPKGSG